MTDTSSLSMKTVLIGAGLLSIACFLGVTFVGSANEKHKQKDEKFPVFKKPSSNSSIVKDGVNGDESMRGYKRLADGRTTSYFSREISDEDRRLLAETNTGPQRIDPGSSANVCASPTKLKDVHSTTASNPGSKWNSAGTYEEKDISSWAKSRLRSLLTNLNVRQAGGTSLNVYIDAVHEVKGDASFVVSRSKSKFIYDLSLEISFLLTNSSNNNPTFVLSRGDTKGKMTLSDITADASDDVLHSVSDVVGQDTDRRAGGNFQKCIGASISSGSKGTLLHAISEVLKTFLVNMKNEFGRSSEGR